MRLTDDQPDSKGYFGEFGGRFVPETLIFALEELAQAFGEARRDSVFDKELERELTLFGGRPTPLLPVTRLSSAWGGDIALKREDLCHTGAHKINNVVGQTMLAMRLGKKRIVAETGAGQHGVATAAACARMGLACRVYMGSVDMERQAPNVDRMMRFGAEVVPVTAGQQTLKEAINEAIRDWVANVRTTHYLLGSVVGPHPYPMIVRDFQSVIGREAKQQALDLWGNLPDMVVACVGGGSNAIGLFSAFLPDEQVELLGIEAGGCGDAPGEHAASIVHGSPGVLHGTRSMLLQDPDGQILDTRSVSAGLDYPGVGPELAFLESAGRARFETATDQETLDALEDLCRLEGILPALESAHALAGARRLLAVRPGLKLIIGLSGRGDKDLEILRRVRPKTSPVKADDEETEIGRNP